MEAGLSLQLCLFNSARNLCTHIFYYLWICFIFQVPIPLLFLKELFTYLLFSLKKCVFRHNHKNSSRRSSVVQIERGSSNYRIYSYLMFGALIRVCTELPMHEIDSRMSGVFCREKVLLLLYAHWQSTPCFSLFDRVCHLPFYSPFYTQFAMRGCIKKIAFNYH